MSQTQSAVDAAAAAQTSENGKREQSTIAFPYMDLNEGIKVAKAVFEVHGSTCQVEQAAAQMNESPTSSNFRTKIATAKTFGLLSTGQGALTLTKLGSQICDSQQEKAARAEAFLSVALYKAVYEKFKGNALPPTAGLEAAMVSLGVSERQKERARQIFQRSAQQAGFFQFGNDRLILPAIKAATTAPVIEQEDRTEQPDQPEGKERGRKGGSGGGGEEYDPLIQGLLRRMPPSDTEWAAEERTKWMQALVKVLDLMYTGGGDNRKYISVELKTDSAK